MEGKNTLVTGGGAGIGRAICELLAEHGTTVAVVDLDETLGKETVDIVTKAGGQARFYQCDVAKLPEIEKTYYSVRSDYGQVDILVNNCGIANTDLIVDLKEEDWRHLMSVNLDAMYRFCKLSVADMLKRNNGAIVNISSLGGIVGGPNGLAYTTSKFGVNGLTRALAADHAKDGIRINAVAPGMTYTNMAKVGFESTGDHDKAKADLVKAVPIGRMAEPKEIAAGVLFLASDLASYCAGVILTVDGGLTECFWPHGA